MTKVLAFDQATTTGWTFGGTQIDLKDWKSGRFKAPKRDEEGERLCIIEDGALSLIDEFEPDLIAYEEPYDPTWDAVTAAKKGKPIRRGFDRKVMQFLQRVKGAIIMAAARRSIATESYQPRTWQATLKVPAQKPFDAPNDWKKRAVMEHVRRMGGKVETFDEADSFGICYHACHGKAGIKRATDDLFERVRAQL